MERGSGFLVHISELPSKYGIGAFSKEARSFVKLLKYAGQKYWQILPLNPTGFKDSPYQSNSAFALNPYFIDLDALKKKDYLSAEEIKEHTKTRNNGKIDYGYLYEHRFILLNMAARKAIRQEKTQIDAFLRKNKYWLEDYSLFLTLKKVYQNKMWCEFDEPLKKHQKKALEEFKKTHLEEFYINVAIQYFAFKQYQKLKKYANRLGVKIIGDLPIYVSYDSSDVWANQKDFLLNRDLRPTLVAGVPPDYFSKTGQLWGNPIYDYEHMEKNHFRWWTRRIKHASKLYDVIRIDHFRGFSSYYTVKATESNAINGTWNVGPREKIIDIFSKFSKAQIIAEDLGDLSDDVFDLMKYAKYPGIKVFQFAFDGNPNNKYLPHMYESNAVAYLGTHDNDMIKNFIMTNPQEKEQMKRYLNIYNDNDIIDTSIGALMRSNADVVVFMPQDILGLGAEARINVPGKDDGNWTFRFQRKDFEKEQYLKMYHMACESGRY